MKKVIIILTFLFCVVNYAQDFSGVKILIYPGGNSTAEEENDNYDKAKLYGELLKNFGAEVFVIDNSKNRLPISQIAAITNQNKVDFFHVIESKELTEEDEKNSSLVIYNSFENMDIKEAAKLILDGTVNSNRIDNKYLSGENENDLSGDLFLGLNSPGLISIDSRNKSLIESNNFKNEDYAKNEVWGYIRGLINFYETKPYGKGFIAGLVKDKNGGLDVLSTNGTDSLKPVNNIKVTLNPGGKTYVGDFKGNGFYYFDSLEPGEYELIYEAGTYSAASKIVTVASNQTTFVDMLLEKDFSIPPSVFNYSPHDTTKQIDTESEIKIVFSIPMDQETAEESFSIKPSVDGKFEWESEDHVLRFLPYEAMNTSTRYQVIIKSSAKGKNNINMERPIGFYFYTKPHHAEVNIENKGDSVITIQQLYFKFSKPMDKEETEDAFEIEPKVEGHFEWSPDFTELTFVPDKAYLTSTNYLVTIDEDAETYNGLYLGYDYKFEFVTSSSHIRPEIKEVKPEGITDTVFINSDIVIEFNEPMQTESINESFVIEPEVGGRFEWNSENTKLRFIPEKLLIPGTNYKVQILNTAKNRYGVNLKDNYEFVFPTNNRGRLQLVKNYPVKEQKNISTSSKIKLEFNYPVDINVLSENISLYNSSGKSVPLTNFSINNENEKFIVYCEPASALDRNTEYNLSLSKNIKDELDIPLLDNISINFKTEAANTFEGDVVEGFEETSTWIKVDSNNASTGIEKGSSYFEKDEGRKISGKYSGKIVYKFNKDKGTLKLEKMHPLNLFNNSSEAGLWIFGDLSSNLLSVKLLNDNAEVFDITIDTLNWSGWKFKRFNLNNFAADNSNNIYLNSILIKHTSKGDSIGEIYLDDLQISKVNDLTKTEETLPSEFSLEQNFPNPFNPTTTISFKIPESSIVTLEVLNILGQKVRTLIRKESYSAGTWSVEWDAKSDYGEFMPSGVYLYKLRTGDFTEVKKMILIK